MRTRRLGDTEVSAIGLGAMPMTAQAGYDVDRGVRTIHAALDAGVTLVDTADGYGPSGYGANEALVARAMASYPGDTDGVVVATKGGHTRDGETWDLDGSPGHLRWACEQSLRRLGVETIGLYQHHRPDPNVPYEDSMGGLRALYDAGLVRRVGISNAAPDQIAIAQTVLGEALVAVQNEFSPRHRASEPEIGICAERGLAFLPWSPLGGISGAKDLGSAYRPFAEVGQGRGVSPQQVCLAWELARSAVVIPIPGASRPESILDSVRAVDLELTPAELAELDAVHP